MAKLSTIQEEIIYQMRSYFDNDDANSICLADLSDLVLYEEDDLKEEVDILLDMGILGQNQNSLDEPVFYIV